MTSRLNLNPEWLVPDWPVAARVRALCTTRAGGVSRVPFAELNLGLHVGDDAAAALANRFILRDAIAARPVFLSQVHGTEVASISSHSPDGMQADGCITAEPGVACTIMVADCLPVLFCNAQGSVVAAAHAGWRGLAGQRGSGILEATVAALGVASVANDARHILAWLGPCIGPQQFEVGSDVRDVFVADDRAASAMFAAHGTDKWLADLQGLARLRLAALGVTQIYGNDGTRTWCTASNPAHFFSHRRDRVSGRMAACIWLDSMAK